MLIFAVAFFDQALGTAAAGSKHNHRLNLSFSIVRPEDISELALIDAAR